uniref:CSON012585 protein n=1 Tax=Culicoides sonorensis TaxID=179676 RepID=A0A336M5R2_CULSO
MSITECQHVIIECWGSIHSLNEIYITGLNHYQLEALINEFHLQQGATIITGQRPPSYRFTKDPRPMTDVLNFLSASFGFYLVTSSLNESQTQLFLRKQKI